MCGLEMFKELFNTLGNILQLFVQDRTLLRLMLQRSHFSLAGLLTKFYSIVVHQCLQFISEDNQASCLHYLYLANIISAGNFVLDLQ